MHEAVSDITPEITHIVCTQMRELMETIKYDWNTLKNETEYKIIHKYSRTGALYAQVFARKTPARKLC